MWKSIFSKRLMPARKHLIRRLRNPQPAKTRSFLEHLESRTLLSESASAQLNLVSTAGTTQTPVYNYNITLTNTGTTSLGTFWFGWTPGEDFLPSLPSAESSPTGWGNSSGTSSTPFLTGSHNSSDGTGIQWVAKTGSEVAPNQSLSGFTFSTTDSPAALAGSSPTHSPTPAMTSVVYGGAPESDAGFTFVVTPAVALALSITTLGTSNSTINFGDNVTLTATVAPATGTGPTPTGTVTFTQGSTNLGTIAVGSDGAAVLNTTALPVGMDLINATYNGDSNYSSNESAPISETVNAVAGTTASQTTLITSSPSVSANLPVTFTATVAAVAPGGPTPTGMVTFTSDGNSIGSALVQSDGTALLSTMALPVGVHAIVASYSGDSTYASSISLGLTQTITVAHTLEPAIVKSPLPAAIVMGGKLHGTFTVEITNATSEAMKGPATVEVFASADGVIDGSATLVGQVVIHHLNLKSNKSTRAVVPINAMLANLPANTYTLLASTIDPSSITTSAVTGPTVQVAAPFVALTETFTRQTLTGSAVAGAKTHAVAAIKITNGGNITTPGETTVSFYLSTDSMIDSNATLIRSVSKPLRIRPGKSMTVSLPLQQVPMVPVENYTIVAQVIDANHGTSTVVSTNLVMIDPG